MSSGHVAALGRVAHLLAGTEDAAGTMAAVAEEGLRVFGAERVGIFLLDERTGAAEPMVVRGLSPAYLAAVARQYREMHSAGSALRGQPYFARDAREDRTSPIHAAVLHEGFAAVAALPLVFRGRIIGWLAFYHDQPREYAPDEQQLARAFADQASLAIGRSRLLETVSRIKTEWQAAFDGIGSGLALVDGNGRIERGNRFMATLARVEVTALPGILLAPLFRDWPPVSRDPLISAAKRGNRVSLFLNTTHGQHVALTVTPRPEGGFVVAVEDLTEYVRLEARYSQLVETAQEAIVLTDADGAVQFANPAAAMLFGQAAATLVGMALATLLPDDTVRAGPVAGAHRYEALIRRADGVRIADVSVAPLEERGRPAGLVAVARDVTRERLATEALRRSERRFRALFHRAPLAIFTLDHDGQFLSANRATFRLAGLSATRSTATLSDFVVPSDRARVIDEVDRSFRGETRDFMFHYRRFDGAVRQASAVTVPVEERGGRKGILALARDVTDEVELREQLNHAEKMAALGALVSGVAHELNNPLAGIAALAQALQLDAGVPVEVGQGLESMRREAMRAARIVTDLLTFARQRRLERQATDLNALVRETFVTTPALGGDGVDWTLGLDPTLPAVSGDPDQVRQVVTNLLVNASQAMVAAPRREGLVRTWWDEDWVGCEVLDSGQGMSGDALPRVFEPFFTTKDHGHGTGLGLSISHGIVRAHGGEIRGENRPEGGACFAFQLPRDPTRISRTPHA
ncbi:MAG: PAS domain S-box protein [Gemmatimonadales bacterium]